ncbi:MAG: polysaccharide deacetylase family protein [Candidatus Hodarchaeota archaeon]
MNVALALDVDRDAPFPKPGLVHGVSLPLLSRDVADLQHPGKSALFEGTIKGLQYILDELDIPIPKIFFLEGRTALHLKNNFPDLLSRIKGANSIIGFHGMDHEDLVGAESNVPMTLEASLETLSKGMRAIHAATGIRPSIFRAPYMRISNALLNKLTTLGINADSSLYLETTKPPAPYRISNQSVPLWEIPVVKYPENQQKFIYMYLWPLFERKRPLEDYIRVLHNLSQNENPTEEIGLCLVNLHPWHLAYSIMEKRYLSNSELAENFLFLRSIIDDMLSYGEIKFHLPGQEDFLV